MLIRLQRIYNFCLFHTVILSILDVLQSFYIIFGTNLLTQCPLPVVVFCMFFTSQEINIKRSPNAMKLYGDCFWTRRNIMGPGCAWGGGCSEDSTTHQGAPGGPGTPWWVVPTSGAPQTTSLLYKYPNILETLGESMKFSSSRQRVQNHEIQSRHHHGGVHHFHWCLSDDT